MGTRLKDVDWKPGTNNGTATTWENVQVAVLLDIRDELKRLNSLLYCHNTTAIPQILRRIQKNTTKPKKKRPTLRSVG